MPASASDASRRSSAIVRTCRANCVCNCFAVGRAAVGQGGEVDLRDAQVLEGHRAQHPVDLRARAGDDDAEALLLRAVRLEGQRRTEVELVVGPADDLRLVGQHLAVGKIDHARPRVGRRPGAGAALRAGGGAAEHHDGQPGRRGEDASDLHDLLPLQMKARFRHRVISATRARLARNSSGSVVVRARTPGHWSLVQSRATSGARRTVPKASGRPHAQRLPLQS